MTATAEELVARLRRNPDDPAAYAALKAHYHQQNDFASLANLVEGWARRVADAEAAARAFHEAALLVEHYAGDHARAVELFESALERDPYLADAHRDLDHMIEAVGDPRLRIDSLERRIEAFSGGRIDPQRLAALRFKLGDAWERGYHRRDRALGQYLAALALDPNFVPALYAARIAYQDAGDFVAAADLLEREASIEPDRDRALALFRELGHLRAQHLGDVDGAVRAAEAALVLAPGRVEVLRDLAVLLHGRATQRQGTPEGIADAERAAAGYFQLAEASRGDEALELCEAALELAPTHEAALDLLEFLAHDLDRPEVLPLRWVGYLQEAPDSPGARRRRHALAEAYVAADQLEDAVFCLEPLLHAGDARAAEALSRIYAELGRPDDASAALAVVLSALPSEERAARLRATIEALDSEGRRAEAIHAARELLAADPSDEVARRFLDRAYDEAGDTASRVALRMELGGAPALSVDTRTALLREAAEVATASRQSEAANDAFRALLELEPGAKDALAHLTRHLEAGARWDELAALLERSALTLTDPVEKSALLLELTTLHREKRRDVAEAVRVLRAARELAPGDRAVRDQLCDLVVEAGSSQEAIPLLHERLAEAPDKDARIRLQHALADALESGAGDLDGAYLVSQRIVETDPRDVRALARMERIDLALGHPHRLLDTLGRRAAIGTEEERAALLSRMAEVSESALGEVDRAASLYRQALELAPRDVAAREGLRVLLGRAEKHEELAALLDELVATEGDLERRRAYLRELARVAGGALGDRDRAAAAYSKLLDEIDDPEALAALVDHAQRSGDLEAWVALAARQIAHLGDTEAAHGLRLARASVLVDDLGRLEEGAEALVEALAFTPPDATALARLADVYEALGDLARLAETLEKQVALVDDDTAKAPLEAKLSKLYAGPLGDAEAALRVAREWVRHAPYEAPPLEHLAQLLEAQGPSTALLEALDALVAIDPPHGREHLVRAARLCAEAMGDVDGGFDRLAARLDEGDDGILPALRAYALEHGRARALAELLDRHALAAGEGSGAFALYDAAATIWLDHVGDARAAMASALRAFSARPGDIAALERLESLAALADDFDGLIEAYRVVLASGMSEDDQVEWIVRLAGVLERRACDPVRALEAVGSACARRPLRDDLFARADELARAAARYDILLGIYERRVGAATPEVRFSALLRCAEIACENLGELERALAHFGRAAALAASRAEDLARVESLAAKLDAGLGKPAGDPCRSRLSSVYASLAERPGIGAARTTLLLRAARMLAGSLGRAGDAFELLKSAVSAEATDARIHRELLSLARTAGLLPELAVLLDRLATEAMDARTAARFLAARADLLRDELDRVSEAADVLRKIVTLLPSDPRARQALRHALQAAGRFEDLVMTLEKDLRGSSAASPEERRTLRRVVAMTWEGPLHNRWEAMDAWKALTREFPDDEEALEALRRLDSGGALRADPPPALTPPAPALDVDPASESIPIGTAPVIEDEILALDSLADVLLEEDDASAEAEADWVDDVLEPTLPGPITPRTTAPPPPPVEARRRSTVPPPQASGRPSTVPPPPESARRRSAFPPAAEDPQAEPPSGLDTLMDIADFVDELDESASREEPFPETEVTVAEPHAEREPEPT